METEKKTQWKWIARTAASGGATVSALLFGHGFANDEALLNHITNADAIYTGNIQVQIFLALLATVFVGYLLASSTRHEVNGSLLTLCAVAGLYLWAPLVLFVPLSLSLLALAIPAGLHLVAAALGWMESKSTTVEHVEAAESEDIAAPVLAPALPASPEQLKPAVA